MYLTHAGEPNDYLHPNGEREDCTALMFDEGKWNDVPCFVNVHEISGVICEKSAKEINYNG
jgi:hypothetical protein